MRRERRRVLTLITIISWIAVALVLAAYASNTPWFDRANVVLCVPVALPAIIIGAYSSAAISLAFGAIAAVHMIRRRSW